MDRDSLYEFCHSLPKVELHAHLNTSFSESTLESLVKRKAEKNADCSNWKLVIGKNEKSTIDEIFSQIKLVQQVCNDEHSIFSLAYDIIHEFASDNVKYLELRSTPKDIPETGMTRELYVETILRAIKDCEAENLDIVVRLLLSIDRRNGVDIGQLTVDLAEKYAKLSDGVVLGIDFSGDPQAGNAADYIPVFKIANIKKLKLSLHLAEIAIFEETLAVLKEGPCDRIGHGTFLHLYTPGQGHEEMEDIVLQKKIPIEACMTSNVKSGTVKDYKSHHLEFWYNKKHPVIICTDGKGSFQTTLSQEYVLAAQAFSLSRQQMWDLSLESIEHIFASDTIKEALRKKWLASKSQIKFS